jgi:hypothetical protein
MKKYQMAGFILMLGLTVSGVSYANVFSSMVNILRDIAAAQAGINASSMDIDAQLKQLNAYVSGNAGWGTYQFHDYQSYGGSGNDWSRVVQMAAQGSGSGDLGGAISGLANQFPIHQDVYNQSVIDPVSQQYYAVKSGTVLAARAASQLDYNRIQDQIAYQQMLQQQIERTKDLKGAVDLSSRIQVEGNLIALEMLRQSALANQQQSITEQGSIVSALSNARFLSNINYKEKH